MTKRFDDFRREHSVVADSEEERLLLVYLLAMRLMSCRKLISALIGLN